MTTTPRKLVTIAYNGFHGRRRVRVLARVSQPIEPSQSHTTTHLTISRSAALRINRMACGCHECKCGEGVVDIYDTDWRQFDHNATVTIRVNEDYEYRGRYPQQ